MKYLAACLLYPIFDLVMTLWGLGPIGVVYSMVVGCGTIWSLTSSRTLKVKAIAAVVMLLAYVLHPILLMITGPSLLTTDDYLFWRGGNFLLATGVILGIRELWLRWGDSGDLPTLVD